jgi:membrane-associated protein
MDQLHDLISTTLFSVTPFWRDVIVFVSSYLEGLPIIGSILPGGTVALVIGSLTKEGFLSPLWAVNLIAVGSMLGDLTGFYLGPKLLRYNWFKKFVQKEGHQKHWDLFDRHIALVLIFGKLLPVVRSMPSLFAGARSISKVRYFIYVILGSYLWSFAGIFGGNILAQVFGKAAIPLILIAFIAIGIAVFLWNKYSTKV